jgi:hypothetical protein
MRSSASLAIGEAVAACTSKNLRRPSCPWFTENIEFYLKLGYRVDREEDVGCGTIKVELSKTLGPGPLA